MRIREGFENCLSTGPIPEGTHPIIFNGALPPVGHGIIAVGIFGATDAQISAAGGNPTQWAFVGATFQRFGVAVTMGANVGNNPELFGFETSANVAGTVFSGKNIYLAIGDGPTLAVSSQAIVFKSNTLFADEPSSRVHAGLADAFGTQAPAGDLLLGTRGLGQVWYPVPGIINPWTGRTLSGIIAARVPEPTTTLLGVLGLGCGLIRRRAAWFALRPEPRQQNVVDLTPAAVA